MLVDRRRCGLAFLCVAIAPCAIAQCTQCGNLGDLVKYPWYQKSTDDQKSNFTLLQDVDKGFDEVNKHISAEAKVDCLYARSGYDSCHWFYSIWVTHYNSHYPIMTPNSGRTNQAARKDEAYTDLFSETQGHFLDRYYSGLTSIRTSSPWKFASRSGIFPFFGGRSTLKPS